MKRNGKTIDLGIREGVEYLSKKYTHEYACTVSDRSSEKPVGEFGEWVYADTIAGMRYYSCTICAKTNDGLYETLADENEVNWWRFCPRCGSKMFTKEEKKND